MYKSRFDFNRTQRDGGTYKFVEIPLTYAEQNESSEFGATKSQEMRNVKA